MEGGSVNARSFFHEHSEGRIFSRWPFLPNETRPPEHPRIATTQWDRISMEPFQVPLKTSQCTFLKVNGRPSKPSILFFPSFQRPASLDTK